MFSVSFAQSTLPFFLLSFVFASTTTTPSSSPVNISNTPIRDLAVPRYFGTAANTSFLFHDVPYTNIAETQFSIFTPEKEMKWEPIEPIQGIFNFGPADEIVRFAHSVNGRVRGHNFVWNTEIPPWINASLTGTELDAILQNHIHTVMTHYKKDKIYAWDIVNEPISDALNVSVYKPTIWTQKLGEEVVAKALTYAHAADPSVRLYINEYGAEGINNKSDNLYNVVKGLQNDGIPLHGIGFQCHFSLGEVPPTLQENLERFAALDLDVAITELDINLGSFGNETLYEAQARDYAAVVNACVDVPRCVSVTTWGITDDHSWIPGMSVLPWNGEGQPKPAFFAIQEAFVAAKSKN